jgi:hypothetical protein
LLKIKYCKKFYFLAGDERKNDYFKNKIFKTKIAQVVNMIGNAGY